MTLDINTNQSIFAVIETGGKQYKVFNNDLIEVEKTGVEVGQTLTPKILAICDENNQIFNFSTVDKPLESNITLEVVEHDRKDKVLIFKRKRRKNHQRLNGHKQHFDLVKISLNF